MFENVTVNWQSSTCIETHDAVIYLDPWQLKEECHDADIICITHPHFDHLSPEDINKIKKADTVLIAPESIKEEVIGKTGIPEEKTILVSPGENIHIESISITTVPAYNVGKPFHKKEYGWLGYLIEADGTRYYFAGDTDANEDVKQVKCDLALVPVGGYYTMDWKEAAELINTIKPEYTIPVHFGCVEGAGKPDDDKNFAGLISKETETVFKLHR